MQGRTCVCPLINKYPIEDNGQKEHTMFKRVSSILMVLATIGIAAGCSDAPTAKYEAGQAALENARLAEAELYAPELFKDAADSLNAAMVEMQKQDGRFVTFRSYGKSEEMIASAQQLAEKAGVEAAAEKERVRAADSALAAEIEIIIIETRTLMSKAPKGKGSRIDLKVMQADIDAASGALAAAKDEFNAGSYLSANEKLQAVMVQATRVKSDIEAALARTTKK